MRNPGEGAAPPRARGRAAVVEPPAPGLRRRRRERSRARIVGAAARLVREKGPEGVGVAEVMRAARLTHGAFYVHFPSKRALLEAALAEAGESARDRYFARLAGRRGAAWLRAAMEAYLRPEHRDDPGEGCPFAALGGDVARHGADLRRAFERQLGKSAAGFAARFAAAGEGAAEDMALATLALCAGGLTLSRAVQDPALSRRILAACRAAGTRWLGRAGEKGSAGRAVGAVPTTARRAGAARVSAHSESSRRRPDDRRRR